MLLGVIPFPWYFPPLYPGIALLIGAGVVAASRLAGRFRPSMNVAGPCVACLLLLMTSVIQLRAVTRYQVEGTTPYFLGYREVADWLRNNTPADASVALTEIGIIGYYSERPVVDTMGLVSPRVTAHLDNWYQTVAYAVAEYWPDYAVALKGTAWDALANAPWFQTAYAPVVTIPSAGPGSREATIYQRKSGFPVQKYDLARALDYRAGDSFSLVAVRLASHVVEKAKSAQASGADSAAPGPDALLNVQLEWQDSRPLSRDVWISLDLVSTTTGHGRQLAEEQPMHGGNPTFLWRPGETILDDYSLRIPDDLEAGAYILKVTPFIRATSKPVVFTDAAGRPVVYITAGPVWVGRPALSAPSSARTMEASFGDDIQLTGFSLGRNRLAPGDSVDLVLDWRARQPIQEDFTVFVHVIGADGRIVAQKDNPPLNGNLPTSLWLPGVDFHDKYQVALPSSLPSGQYSLEVGLYRYASGERLPARSDAQPVRNGAARLTDFTVQ
jgi:hypothetical protein